MTPKETVLERVAPPETGASRLGLTLTLLGCGHFFVDLYSGALGALQPLLVHQFKMSLTDAGILGGAMVLSSSVMQPVYGYLSDRWRTKWFAALGPAVAGLFVSAMGLAPNYAWLVVMVCLGGTGVAAFHPQASAGVAARFRQRRGGAMAAFISAGTLGYALGPTLFSVLATRWGLANVWWGAAPGLLCSGLLLQLLPGGSEDRLTHHSSFDWRVLLAVWKPMAVLYLLVFIRSTVQVTFAQLIPLYLHLERGYSTPRASYTLSLYLFCGAVGGFLGGHLSDRLGGRRVILISMAGSVPLLALFFFAHGWLSVMGLLGAGLMLLFTIPVNVVMAQELVPGQAGTVSALMMGFAWGTAGLIFVPLTGGLADVFSLHWVLTGLSAFPVLGFLLALRLPK